MLTEALLILLNSLFYALVIFAVSSGFNLIFGVMKIVNLAHGHFYSLAAFISAFLLLNTKIEPIYLAFLLPFLAALITSLVGLAFEVGLLRPIYRKPYYLQILLTLGVIYIFNDLFCIIFGRAPLQPTEICKAPGSIIIFNQLYPLYNLIVIGVSFTIGVILWLLLYKTKFGIALRAVSLDTEISLALGIDIKKIYTLTFVISVALAGIAGGFIVPVIAASLGIAEEMLILSLIVTIIGGMGSLKGALISSLIVSIFRSFAIFAFPEFELLVIYLVATIVLLIRPVGLFGGG